MKGFLFLFLVIINVLFFSGCPLPGSDEDEMIEEQEKMERIGYILYGGNIINFPSWFGNSKTGINSYSVSSWHFWNSSEAEELRKFIGDCEKKEDYSGMYQLVIEGQDFYINFDDEHLKKKIFFNCIPILDYGTTFGQVFISQSNSDEYNYTAIVKKSIYDTIQGINTIKLIKNYGYKSEFNYRLCIDGTNVVNEVFTTIKPYSVEVALPDWLRYMNFSLYVPNIYGKKFFGFKYQDNVENGFPYLSYVMQKYLETSDSVIYLFEGISQNQPKYLKIENKGNLEFNFIWYKELNEEPVETIVQKAGGGMY